MRLDIIGDIHGRFAEFKELTLKLDYSWKKDFLSIQAAENWPLWET